MTAAGSRPEVDRSSEDPLEGVHQPPILRAALLHPKGVKHGSSMAAALSNVILGVFWRIAIVAKKIGTRRSCPHGRP
jgi:hypothetical protein